MISGHTMDPAEAPDTAEDDSSDHGSYKSRLRGDLLTTPLAIDRRSLNQLRRRLSTAMAIHCSAHSLICGSHGTDKPTKQTNIRSRQGITPQGSSH